MTRCRSRIQTTALLLLSACRSPDSPAPAPQDPVTQLAALDPMFGGGDSVVGWLDRSPLWSWRGDPAARAHAVRRERDRLDVAARELCAQQLSGALAADVLAFVRTDAGQAMVEAERTALAGLGRLFDDLPSRLAQMLADPDRVGGAAREAVRSAIAAAPSPMLLSLEIACCEVAPAEARAIADFVSTAEGAAWMRARDAAFPVAREAFGAAVDRLTDAGYLRRALDDAELEDLVLPRAEFVESEPANGR
ncbi:MAG: hypothetical protein KDE27_28800 [Planctomycetes bacterium]|nr:hypothetical protein [Planctomycetota bacterium]